MKKIILLFSILFLALSSCGVKSTQSMLSDGNYDGAIDRAVEGLRTKKDSKGKQDYVYLLEEAFAKAKDRDLRNLEMLSKDANPANAERIDVGKRAGGSHTQVLINELLVTLGRNHQHVIRLKGGDPFVFGRGGEEIQALLPHNIAFQVVPGVTAAAGCAAYAGIPLTHRDHTQSVQFVTGHCRKDGTEPDWHSMSKANQTLVIYMGLMKAGHIQQQLMAAGRSGSVPVAIIENGTRSDQRVVTGSLDQLAQLIAHYQLGSPALLVIGEVVSLQQDLHWFGKRPQTAVFSQTITQME